MAIVSRRFSRYRRIVLAVLFNEIAGIFKRKNRREEMNCRWGEMELSLSSILRLRFDRIRAGLRLNAMRQIE